ncbi:ABC transporter permease [Haloechinothrix halophila]|uniref:ABC transporter permease n=1 Tax=Haloechinothrix halophila TaxID=1069073 RepID=UPI000402F548|nr:ABC transporter permease [Haloechinothrix halophila]
MTAPSLGLGRHALRLARTPSGSGVLAAVSAGFLVCVAVAAVFAPWLAPHDPTTIDLANPYAAPSAEHPFGTDDSGRDLLSRLLHGARLSLAGPALVAVLSLSLGTALAVVAAWCGGWVDSIVSRAIEIVFAFPGLLLAVIAAAVFGPGLTAPVCALAIAYAPLSARVIRSVAIRERNLPYVAALQIQGQSPLRICALHVLPNLLPIILVQAGLAYAYALLDLAAISFLGLGVQPPAPDWGVMITNGQGAIVEGYPQQSILAAGTVLVTVLALNLVTSRLADRFNIEGAR